MPQGHDTYYSELKPTIYIYSRPVRHNYMVSNLIDHLSKPSGTLEAVTLAIITH